MVGANPDQMSWKQWWIKLLAKSGDCLGFLFVSTTDYLVNYCRYLEKQLQKLLVARVQWHHWLRQCLEGINFEALMAFEENQARSTTVYHMAAEGLYLQNLSCGKARSYSSARLGFKT